MLKHSLLVCFVVAVSVADTETTLSPGSYYADIDDIRMYYEIHGRGEPVLLIHGGFANLEFGSLDYRTLGKHFMVIAPECRGNGRTTDSEKDLSYHLMAEDMIKLLDHLGIKKTAVAGWSDGGSIGIDMAVHHQERISKLISIGANFAHDGLSPGVIQWLREEASLETWPQEAVTTYGKLAPDPEHVQDFLNKTIKMWLSESEPDITIEDLKTIKCPTLIIAGDYEDETISLDHLVAMFRSIPGSQLMIIPGSTHMVPYEKPDVVNNAIIDFVKNGEHFNL